MVSGQWQFVSGCHNAQFFGGMVDLRSGGVSLRAGKRPVYAIVSEPDFEILDTWHTTGLRGSGSHDVRLDRVFVPEEHIAIPHRPWLTKLHAETPLLRVPMNVRLAYNKVAVALGIARAALDEFTGLASGKIPRFGLEHLRDRPFAQRAIAQAEVRLRSARALVYDMLDELWDMTLADEAPDAHWRAMFQIACSDAARAATEAVDIVAEASGTTSNFEESPLERLVRDVRVVGKHITVAPHLIEDAGRVLLGLEPETYFLNRLA